MVGGGARKKEEKRAVSREICVNDEIRDTSDALTLWRNARRTMEKFQREGSIG